MSKLAVEGGEKQHSTLHFCWSTNISLIFIRRMDMDMTVNFKTSTGQKPLLVLNVCKYLQRQHVSINQLPKNIKPRVVLLSADQ